LIGRRRILNPLTFKIASDERVWLEVGEGPLWIDRVPAELGENGFYSFLEVKTHLLSQGDSGSWFEGLGEILDVLLRASHVGDWIWTTRKILDNGSLNVTFWSMHQHDSEELCVALMEKWEGAYGESFYVVVEDAGLG
jgi:hypothetical protein